MKTVAIAITALGLTLGACGKKTADQPAEPTPAKVDEAKTDEAKVDEVKTDEVKVDEAKADEAKTDEAKADEATTDEAKTDEAKTDEAKTDEAKTDEAKVDEAKTDRAGALVAGFEMFNEGKLDEAYASFADDVVFNQVGDPMTPKIEGKEAFLALRRAHLAAFPDAHVTPVRVFDAGEWVIAEVVMTGTYTKPYRGMEPTHKPFGVAFALARHFRDDGKIDRVDSFFDAATMMMQVGAVPVPAEMGDMKLVTAPKSEPEIIKGEANDANVATITQWYADFNKDGLTAAIDKYWADDFTYHGLNEGVEMKGKEANKKYLEEMMFGMFPDWAGKVDSAVSVGDYVIAWSTNTGTYKGGMPGVEASDQKITSHSLDVSKVADGKITDFTYYGNGLEFMSQLGMLGGAGGDKEGDADVPGMDEAADAVKEAAGEVDKAMDEANDAMKAAGDAVKAAGAATDDANEAMKAGMGVANKAMDNANKAMDDAADEMKKAADEMKNK